MKKRLLFVFLIILVIVSPVFAGGEKEQATTNSDEVKIALIVENTIDDKGWCQAMHDGILAAQKDNPKIAYEYSEKMKPVDAGSAARQFASDGFNIIIAHGAQYKNLILDMADEYPNITFCYGTSAEPGPDNVFTYMPESEETGYLNGLIAGLTTKTNKIGIVGPVDGGDAARYNRGFYKAVKDVNPNCSIMVAHTGSFGDLVKAGEVAQTQIKNGADVLTGSAQQALGALRTVADYPNEEIWWCGQDLAQLKVPESYKVLAASSYNYAAVVKDIVEKKLQGINGGEVIPLNFKNGGFVFEFNPERKDKITPEIKKVVEDALAQFEKEANCSLVKTWKEIKY